MSRKNMYKKAMKIEYKGVLYDSLLELRFVLIIEDRCSWIREPNSIFYDPRTFRPTNYITEDTRRYTPDFLVRKWIDNTAHLIELKPEKFKDCEQMKIRRKVVENYLAENDLDWKFSVLSKQDLKLNEQQQDFLKKVIEQNRYLKNKLKFIRKDKRYNSSEQRYFSNIPHLDSDDISYQDYVRYVRYGKLPK